VANDAFVPEECRHVARRVPRNAIDIEICEGAAEIVALPENRQPAQAGLKPLEADLLE